MGIFSEINMTQEYDSTPTPEDCEQISAFAEEVKTEAVPKTEQPNLKVLDGGQTKPTAGTADSNEDSKRKAHEEAEAKRKAEFDARQAAKKAAMQEKLDRLAAMSDDEVMVASMKQVSADTEKLTRRNMKDCVSEHIQTLCLDDPAFARRVMHPGKSMVNCFRYITQKAWEYVQDELKASGITPGPREQGYGCDVPDDLCYQWGVDYFNDPDAKVDKEDEEEFVPRSYHGTSSKAKSKKETSPKKAESKKPAPKPAANSGQITLGGFMVSEEKAG